MCRNFFFRLLSQSLIIQVSRCVRAPVPRLNIFHLAVGIVLLHLLFIGFGPNFGHTTEFKIVSAYIDKLRYGVDIFFIISGFFIVYTRLYQYNFLEIFLKRALRLWPVMTFCIIAAFLFSLCDLCKFYPLQNLYSLLFINGIRIANHVNGEYPGLGNIHSSWFLSVLMFVTLFYCSLLKFNKERFSGYSDVSLNRI